MFDAPPGSPQQAPVSGASAEAAPLLAVEGLKKHFPVRKGILSFTVETDGRLPSGEALGDAIRTVDEATGGAPAYYMVNCAHPTHVDSTLLAGDGWTHRVRGLRANASTMSHEELDNAETLDIGDIEDFGARNAALHRQLPQINVLGGCCGTDVRHIDAVRRAVTS